MSRYLAGLLAASVLALPASAAERKLDPDACAKAVAPYLDEQTFAVLHVDLTAIDVDALAAKAAAMLKKDVAALPVPRKQLAATVQALTDAGARDVYVVFSLADMPERSPFLVLPLPKDVTSLRVEAIMSAMDPWHEYGFLNLGRIGEAQVFAGEQATFQRLHDLKPTAFPELAKAFAAADSGLAQLAVFPPKDAGKIIDSIMPTLPAEVGGGSSKVLSHGFRWAAVGFDAPKLKLNVVIQAADNDSAKALLDLLKRTYAAVGKSKEVQEVLPNSDKLSQLLTPQVADDRLTVTLDDEALTAALRPLLPKAQEASDQARSANKLRQLAIAAQDYLDVNSHFPATAAYDKSGKPLLSWRVQLLPWLGEEKLYKEFHLDEPWDSDHNKKLIARMPDVFRAPTADPKLAADGKTTYLAPVGDATMFPAGRGVRISEVTDGTSSTILFVEADDDHAVVWTAPDDLAYDSKEPTKGLGGHFHGWFMAAFADGDAHFLKTDDKDNIRALFTRNGGEVVKLP